jgi:hypothetical protein
MKHFLFFTFFISVSLLSFSQKRDTFNLFQNKKPVKRDAVKEIQAHPPRNKQDSIFYIKYGKSAVKCTGYCFHEATVDSVNNVTVSKALQADKSYPLKTDSAKTTPSQWNMLVSSLEVNSFFSIPEKVGAPGDGGAEYEWIELNYAGRIHRVTFDSTGPDEYDGIKNLLKIFKTMTAF